MRWGRLSPQPGDPDYESQIPDHESWTPEDESQSPVGVTPRRQGESHGDPNRHNHLRRKSLAQDWSHEGVKRLEQLGSQLGIGPCKVHLRVMMTITLISHPDSARCVSFSYQAGSVVF